MAEYDYIYATSSQKSYSQLSLFLVAIHLEFLARWRASEVLDCSFKEANGKKGTKDPLALVPIDFGMFYKNH